MSWIYNLSQSVVGDGCKIMEASSYRHWRSMDVGGYRKVPGIGHVGDLSFLTKGDLEKVGVKGNS